MFNGSQLYFSVGVLQGISGVFRGYLDKRIQPSLFCVHKMAAAPPVSSSGFSSSMTWSVLPSLEVKSCRIG